MDARCAGDRVDTAVPGTPAAAAAPGDMGSGWGSTITIVQDTERLSFESPVFSRYDLQPPLTLTSARRLRGPQHGDDGARRADRVVAGSVEGQTLDHHHDVPHCRSWRGKAVHRRIDAKAVAGIADDAGRGSDPRRRANPHRPGGAGPAWPPLSSRSSARYSSPSWVRPSP